MAPPVSCSCGSCAKCKSRAYMRDWYGRQSGTKKKAISRRVVAAARSASAPRRRTTQTKARTAVNNAVRDGRVKKHACANCGSTRNVEAHHPNHARPMAVRWLCSTCHGKTQRG